MWFPNWSDTNPAVQAQKIARSLNLDFRRRGSVLSVYFSYREADLRLCFCVCRLLVFSRGGSFIVLPYIIVSYNVQNHPKIELLKIRIGLWVLFFGQIHVSTDLLSLQF